MTGALQPPVPEVAVRDGVAELPPGHALIAVLHRHGRRDPAPMLCLADGWGEPEGAVATTIRWRWSEPVPARRRGAPSPDTPAARLAITAATPNFHSKRKAR